MGDTQFGRRILVGVAMADEPGSLDVHVTSQDRHAAEQAMWLAARTGAAVRLFHVAELLDEVDGVDAESLAGTLRDYMAGELEDLAADGRRQGVDVSWGIGRGEPWKELLREAHTWKADLVVVSPHRQGGRWLERLVHGSTVRRLLRKSELPVLVSHPDSAVSLERIVALVDDSPTAAAIVAATRWLAEQSGATPYLLHCLEYPMDFSLHHLPDPTEAIARYHQQVRRKAEALVDALLGDDRDAWTVLLEEGRPEVVTTRVVRHHRIDLAVLASSSERGVATVLLGTTAEAILSHADVSTLVLRPQSWPGKSRDLDEEPATSIGEPTGVADAERTHTVPEWPAPP